MVEQGVAGAFFNDFPRLQHDRSLTHHAHHIQIMADKQKSETRFASQAIKQMQDYGLDAYIKCRGWFIQDKQSRFWCYGPCNANTCTLSAGKLVRKTIKQSSRKAAALRRNTCPATQFSYILNAE
jgi:hypothetical protein